MEYNIVGFDVIIDELSKRFKLLHIAPKIPEDSDTVRQYEDMLASTRKDKFEDNERYLVIAYEQDYHLPSVPFGLCLYNLIRSFQYADIDLEKLIIVTTDIMAPENLLKQIKPLIHNQSLPTIINIEGYGGPTPHPQGTDDFNIKDIERHAVCLMKQPRVHRDICYYNIKQHGIDDRIVIRYRGE